jgi:hypothetical protein
MRFTDHVTLNFNRNVSMAVIFLDIEKAFDRTCYPGLLYNLQKLKFSTNIIKIISYFYPSENSQFLSKAKCPRLEK